MFFDVRLRNTVAPLVASLALFLLAPGRALPQQVELKVDGGSPQVLDLGSPATIQANSSFSGVTITLPNDKPTTLTPTAGSAGITARAWDYDVTAQQVKSECESIPTGADGSLTLDMAKFDCTGFLREGTLIEVKGGSKASYFVMNNRVTPQVGDDIGIALTLVNRWDDRDDQGNNINEGSRVNSGTSFYYSVSNLKTDFLRLIGNASLLNGDPELDLEIGLGLGLLLRTRSMAGTGTGFGLAAGIGYNLMLDEPDERWYTFVGLSVNFNQQGGSQ